MSAIPATQNIKITGEKMPGTLYICATPIGNLEDITLRVLRVLKECDFIAAEDTRHTLRLLNFYEIKKPQVCYHEHNKAVAGPKIAARIAAGESCALVTDAGMPGISDPGEDLIRLCHEMGLPVTICPGASAVVSALALSGLPSGKFCFEGFIKTDKSGKAAIQALATETRTIVLYEAPHKLVVTLGLLLTALGDRNACILRELTKKFEQRLPGTLSWLISYFNGTEPRGEFVIVIEGASNANTDELWDDISVTEHVERYIASGLSEMDAMKRAGKDRGVAKSEIYREFVRGKKR